MPHSRNRFIEPLLLSTLKWSPVVGLVGLRQVGKTTIAMKLAEKWGGDYETFDREGVLQAARERPVEFLGRPRLFCIDEAQKAPSIFPAIKDLVGTQRKPGQFFLTGSVKFTLKKDIQESLTGRIITHELLPFTVSEAHQKESSPFLKRIFETLQKWGNSSSKNRLVFENLIRSLRTTPASHLDQHLFLGGLPIPCFSRDLQKRKLWLQSYFETLLGRDVQLVDPTLKFLSFNQGMSFLKELAVCQGESVNLSTLCAKSALRPAQGQSLLRALEALALVDFVMPHRRTEKSVKKLRVEWKDTGLWCFLTNHSRESVGNNVQGIGLMISCELRSQRQLLAETSDWSFFRSREGSLVPWIFKAGRKTVVLQYLPLENPGAYDVRTLRRIVEETGDGLGIILGPEKTKPALFDRSILLVPWTMVF